MSLNEVQTLKGNCLWELEFSELPKVELYVIKINS